MMQWCCVAYVVLLLLLSHNLKGIKTVVEVTIYSLVLELLNYCTTVSVFLVY